MPEGNRRKMKMLLMVEILRQDSDEEHPVLTSQFISKLAERGITCDRRTLSRDIALLNEFGYDVQSRLVGHEKGYYFLDRKFSVPELKILIDAVQAAGFITEKKTKEFINKIAELGGSHRAEILKTNMVCFNTTKHTNEAIYYNISELENALQEHKKASFYYFDRDEHGEKVYRKNKKRYIVDPMALVFNDDNYYLMCFSSKYDGICNYRVDRMNQVNTEREDVDPDAIMNSSNIGDYNEQAFKMYGGPIEEVTLEFSDKLINIVQDKFGEDISMNRTGKDTCMATVKVQTSPTFWGWLFQFVGQMRILQPKAIMEEYMARARKVVDK